MANRADAVTARSTEAEQPAGKQRKRSEILMFLFLAVIFWPAISIMAVGGYGFLVWMFQLIAGPPGPPPV